MLNYKHRTFIGILTHTLAPKEYSIKTGAILSSH